MDEVEAILQQCSIEWACTTLEGADRMVFRLEECEDCLTTMLNNAVASNPSSIEVNKLLELHSIIGQLLMMWEVTLERLNVTASGGRPRKYVNIPLVSMQCYLILECAKREQ